MSESPLSFLSMNERGGVLAITAMDASVRHDIMSWLLT